MKTHDEKLVVFKRRTGSETDGYGDTTENFDDGELMSISVHPAGGKVLSEMYGERLKYMLQAFCDKDADVKEKDGFCIGADWDSPPDYQVVSVQRYNRHTVLLLEGAFE